MPSAVHTRVAAARARLQAAGLDRDEAEIDARVLAEHVLGWDAARYFASEDEAERPGFADAYDRLIARRAAREPLAYITGEQEFWGLLFEVSPAVLIPRPETELIVESALDAFPDRSAPLSIADVCTGSGCVAVALARERPAARVTAIEMSAPALATAARNAGRHGVDRQISLVQGDLLDGVDGPFDLIVANPPYVPDGDRPSLQPEVREHEPPLALFAGPDGLDVVRRLLPQAASRLRGGATMMIEFGYGQADLVRSLISTTAGLRMVGERRDLQGIPRVAVARRE